MDRIYFYDENFRCIGSRLLKEGEEVPKNATLEVANVGDGQQAYLVNGEWVVSDIPIEPIIVES